MQVDEHSGGLSRADAILGGALAVGAAIGLGAIGPYVRKALALAGESDADTLNLLLMFEYLQVEFYEESKTRLRTGPELRKLIAMLAEQEHEHVTALTAQIRKVGGKPIAHDHDYAAFSYRRGYEEAYLRLGRELETAVVGAYNGAVPLIKSEEALRLAASIVQVEGRHAAVLALQGNEEPAPEAFDPVRSEYQALDSVIRFAGPINSPTG
jgi:rubrerythrin